MDYLPKLEFQLNPAGVLGPLVRMLKESSNNVLFGLQLAEQANELVDREIVLQQEAFVSMHYEALQPDHDIDKNKSNFKKWILRKGFEDLIKGVNLTLIEAYFYCSLAAKQGDITTMKAFNEEMTQLKKTAGKQHLPELLLRVKKSLTGDLFLESEILSINKARNCLVHRNGYVTQKDLLSTEDEELKVKYLRWKAFYYKGDDEIEIFKDDILEPGTQVKAKQVNESYNFKLDEKLNFTYQQFNNLLFTCHTFGSDLVSKVPMQ